jgi:hypothetical protein
MRMRVRALVLLVATLVGVSGLVDSAAAAGVPPPIVEIVTVPPLPGVRFVFDGVRHTANEQGVVRLSLNTPQPATHRLSLVDVMMHQQRRDLTFVRWWFVGNHDQDHRMTITGITVRRHVRIEAAFRATYKVSYSFVDPARGPVDHERVKRVEFYGDNGRMVAGDGSGTLRLVGIEARMSSGTLVAKQVSYTVRAVDVDGSNVVLMSHQTFVPSQKAAVVVPLLLRTAHLSTRDLLFGGAVGSSVALTYPDGQRTTVRLDHDGRATIQNLARDLYTVRVDAPGYSFDRPVALSRNQYIDLPVLTYLDIAVVAACALLVAGGLFVIRVRTRRTHLHRQAQEA